MATKSGPSSSRPAIVSVCSAVCSHLVDRFLLRAGEGGGLPAAQLICPEARLALGDEVDLAEDGATQQDVDPGVEDLVPGGQPHAHHQQGSVVGQVCSSLVGVDHGHQPKDLRT